MHDVCNYYVVEASSQHRFASPLCTPAVGATGSVDLSQPVDLIAGGGVVATPQNLDDALRDSGEIELTWEETTPQRVSRAPRFLSPKPAPSRAARQAVQSVPPPVAAGADGAVPRIVVSPAIEREHQPVMPVYSHDTAAEDGAGDGDVLLGSPVRPVRGDGLRRSY